MVYTQRGTPIQIPRHGLPLENDGRAAVQKEHASDLALMERTLRLTLELISAGGVRITRPRGSSPLVVMVVMTLYVKACKTYRAVQLLCEAGLAEDAHTANQTLLEVLFAIGWILQKASRNRTDMYLAHLLRRDEELLKIWKQTKGLKLYAKKAAIRDVAAKVAEAEKGLGATVVAKLARSYSGLTIRQTAHAIHADVMYELYYRLASRYPHASDLARHAVAPEDGGPGLALVVAPGPSEELGRAAKTASLFLITIAQSIDKKFGLGHETKLQEFGEKEFGFKPPRSKARPSREPDAP